MTELQELCLRRRYKLIEHGEVISISDIEDKEYIKFISSNDSADRLYGFEMGSLLVIESVRRQNIHRDFAMVADELTRRNIKHEVSISNRTIKLLKDRS